MSFIALCCMVSHQPEHRLHHVNPDDPVLTIFWQIWICFPLVYLIIGGAFAAGSLVAYAWIYSCITARITVPINCRHDCSSITKAIIDLQLEISASAQRCGIVYSGRCLADPQGWHRPEDKM